MEHQEIMEQAYDWWQTEAKHLNRSEFVQSLSPLYKAAVQLGNFNYQIGNGGFLQWHDNGYSEDLKDLLIICKRGRSQGIQIFEEVEKLLREFQDLGVPEEYDDTEMSSIPCHCDGDPLCDDCDGLGYIEEEMFIDGFQEFADRIRELKLDSRYYQLGDNDVLNAYQEFLDRIDEDVQATKDPVNYERRKPIVKMIGENGNIFNLLGLACRKLKEVGQKDQVEELQEQVFSCHSYNQALVKIGEYVDIR
jgi:hypothetical protein